MSKEDGLSKICQAIADQCLECGRCVEECLFLRETGLSPAEIAARGPSLEEAYSCTLCGLCETLCPSSLSLNNMFGEARKEAVRRNRIDIEEYRYMFPDRENNMMSFYRRNHGIRYDDLQPDKECTNAFFPGCLMLTYSPELVRKVFAHLQNSRQDLTLITDCCSLPLAQLGVEYRYEKYIDYLKEKLATLKIKYLITACPNCYYQLRSSLSNSPIKLLTVYEALNIEETIDIELSIAIHDSCPDRQEAIFAEQTRQALKQKGYTIRELENNKENATCCGSGGQVTHFRPDLAEKLIEKRWQEFHGTGAQVFTAYCLGCVLNLAKKPGAKKVQHVLNLLLNVPPDFAGAKRKLGQLFEGEQGEKNWEKVMNEEETDNGL